MAATFGLALAAALAAEAAHLPLPWMIGPLLAVAAAGVAGAPVDCPAPARHAGQWIIGIALGLTFTPAVLATVLSLWPVLVLGIAWALLCGGVYACWLGRALGARDAPDRATAFFGAAIGGASEMTQLGLRHGGRADLIAMAHSLRVMIVVVSVPFALQAAGLHGADPSPTGPTVVHLGGLALLAALTLAAALGMHRLHLPNPFVLGALAVSMVLTGQGIELSALPGAVSHAGQLFIGCALASRFSPAFLHSAPRWLAAVAAGTVALMATSAAAAWGLAALGGLPWVTAALGVSPGGMSEMCVTAKVLQLGVPVVTAFHVTRYLVVLLGTGPLFAWLERRRPGPRAA